MNKKIKQKEIRSFELRKWADVDRFFAHKKQENMDAEIGYFRFYFDGTQLCDAWFSGKHKATITNEAFKKDVDDIIAYLRTNVLRSKGAMSSFNSQHADCFMGKSIYKNDYGYESELSNGVTACIRCMPVTGDYCAYLYFYAPTSESIT